MYLLQSKDDNKKFKVNQNAIDAFVMLKNACNFTEPSEAAIIVDCSAQCLGIYVKLINHYETITDLHDTEFEKRLFRNINDEQQLIAFIQEMAIFDSDFFFDAVADLILDRIKYMSLKEMQEYLELEDDFTSIERKSINEHLLEYLLSFNVEESNLKFPLPTTENFFSLKNKFYCLLNAFLARFIKRSRGATAFKLSMINKTIKNENDRHPIKLSSFRGSDKWELKIPGCTFVLRPDTHAEKYFNTIKQRKMIVENSVELYSTLEDSNIGNILCSSLDFAIPKEDNFLAVYFHGNENENISFDPSQCPYSWIMYKLTKINFNFDLFYLNLIAKDFSKKIEIDSINSFDIFSMEWICLKKKANSTKFYKLLLLPSGTNASPNLEAFVLKYMEDDGIIKSVKKLFDIPKAHNKNQKKYIYKVSDIKKHINNL